MPNAEKFTFKLSGAYYVVETLSFLLCTETRKRVYQDDTKFYVADYRELH